MTDEAFAQAIADFFKAKGYPCLGIEVQLLKPFPLVMLWDDDAQISRYIACTSDEAKALDGLLWAEQTAADEEANGNAPCGAVGSVAWLDGWMDSIKGAL